MARPIAVDWIINAARSHGIVVDICDQEWQRLALHLDCRWPVSEYRSEPSLSFIEPPSEWAVKLLAKSGQGVGPDQRGQVRVRAHQRKRQHRPVEASSRFLGSRQILSSFFFPSKSELLVDETGYHMSNRPRSCMSRKAWHTLVSVACTICCVIIYGESGTLVRLLSLIAASGAVPQRKTT